MDFELNDKAEVWQDLKSLYSKTKKDLSEDKYKDKSVLEKYPLAFQYLNYAYLRPFSALWDLVVGTKLSKIDFLKPALDLGCGDGIFSSIFKGVVFDDSFDMSDGLSFDKKDIFDTFDKKRFSAIVKKKSDNPFSVGIDIKQNLVMKAELSGGYDTVRVDDGMLLATIEDGSIGSIWTNVIKNFEDIETSVKNCYRVLRNDGFVVAQLPLDSMINHFYYYTKYKEEKDLKRKAHFWKMTRGEPDYHPRYLDVDGWSEYFKQAGFKKVELISYSVNKYLFQFWDTGLRIFIGETSEAVSFLKKIGVMQDVKKHLVDWLIQESIPLLNYEEIHSENKDDYCFALIKATK